jgi:HrpA-like RNA helicase
MPNIDQERRLLPTYEYKQDLIDAIREHSFLVVIGETGKLLWPSCPHRKPGVFIFHFKGSGKTTQIPQYILEEMPEMKKIGVTQPRYVTLILKWNCERASILIRHQAYCGNHCQ